MCMCDVFGVAKRTKTIFVIAISIYLIIYAQCLVSGIVTKRLQLHGHLGFDHAVGVLFYKNQQEGEKLKQRRVA